jgi:hypothetical protein
MNFLLIILLPKWNGFIGSFNFRGLSWQKRILKTILSRSHPIFQAVSNSDKSLAITEKEEKWPVLVFYAMTILDRIPMINSLSVLKPKKESGLMKH